MDDRAQIAAMCLQGLLAGRQVVEREQTICIDTSVDGCAALAVLAADCLIEELSKTPPPARTKETPRPPTDPGESEAGEPKGAASARAEQGLASAESGAHRIDPSTVSNLTSPVSVSVFDCEARFEHDPVCPGPVAFDPVSKGRFCGLHAQIPEGHRREMHRLHGHRNRPLAPVARLAG
jgi:hypothetical protein